MNGLLGFQLASVASTTLDLLRLRYQSRRMLVLVAGLAFIAGAAACFVAAPRIVRALDARVEMFPR